MCGKRKRTSLSSTRILFWSQVYAQCQKKKYYPTHTNIGTEYKTYRNIIPEKVSQEPCEPYTSSAIRNYRIWITEFSSPISNPCCFPPLKVSQTWASIVKSETMNSLLLVSHLSLCKKSTSLNENTEVTPWTKLKQLQSDIMFLEEILKMNIKNKTNK